MARIETISVVCDNCGKSLPSYMAQLNIVTPKQEDNPWKRLHVLIKTRTGYHNRSEESNSDLCKKCAIALLEDAVKRIKLGERTSPGVEEVEKGTW